MEQRGIKVDYEFTISEMGAKKIPTLDFDTEEVKRIAEFIVEKVNYNNK